MYKMKNKRLQHIAKQILEAEQKIELGECVQMNKQKIQGYMATLSFSEMLAIDEYIMSKKDKKEI